jgi:uncharacterized protein (TIGR01244 family)
MIEIRQPFPGVYSAGQPTREALAGLARAGVRTVINLRAPGEAAGFDEPGEAARLGLRYVSLPVGGAQDLTPDIVARFSSELAAARAGGGVLVHCGSANRAGALIALEQAARGVPREDAIACGCRAGLAGLRPAVEELLAVR